MPASTSTPITTQSNYTPSCNFIYYNGGKRPIHIFPHAQTFLIILYNNMRFAMPWFAVPFEHGDVPWLCWTFGAASSKALRKQSSKCKASPHRQNPTFASGTNTDWNMIFYWIEHDWTILKHINPHTPGKFQYSFVILLLFLSDPWSGLVFVHPWGSP